jgi:hypothetical protein
MDGIDYWRLCDELTVVQAALLIAGCDPSSDANYVEGWNAEQRPIAYEAAKTAISNALRRGAITGRILPIYDYDINGNTCGVQEDSIDLASSRVEVDSFGWQGAA